MRRTKSHSRFKTFIKNISDHTPFTKMLLLLIVLWLIFSAGIYFAEENVKGTTITSYGKAMYWGGVAAFSTAGIADAPISGTAQIVGGVWIVLGSTLFFGTIVATVTTYFMRPMLRPHQQIIDTIEYNLEQLADLTHDELDLLQRDS